MRTPFLDSALSSLRSALHPRGLGFSLAVILTLALGIGANVGAFSLINTVVLRPLPFSDSERTFLVFEQDSIGARQLASYPTFLDWHARADVFDGLAFVRGTALSFRTNLKTNFVLASFVTEDFFHVFDVSPLLGRRLDAGDFQEGAPAAAVISHKVWTSVFGADPSAIGETVRIDDAIATVVGVLPATFALPQWTPAAGNDVWMALQTLPAADRSALMQRDFHADSRVVARVKDDLSIDAAVSVMNGIASQLALTYPATSRRWTQTGFVPQRDMLIGNSATPLFVLGAAVVTILLICYVNLANLFLSRGAARRLEFAIRAAIGAGRWQVFRQLLREIVLLTSMGALLGFVLALVGVNLLRAYTPNALPRLNELAIDWRVVLFTLIVTGITAFVFTMVSARQVWSSNLALALRQSKAATGKRAGPNVRHWLMTAQVALSVVLLIGAGLLVKSFVRLSTVDPGFRADGLAMALIEPRLPQYQSATAARDLYQRVAQSVAAIPGIQQVGLINHAPGGGGSITSRASRRGDPRAEPDEIVVLFRTVSDGYFDLMGIPVLAGREFSPMDLNGPPGPLIVNETFARQWGAESPIGQPLSVLKAARDRDDFGEPIFGTIVGVVGDVKHFGPESQESPVVYAPFTHNVWSQISLIARTNGNPGALLDDIESAVRAVEPGLPLEGLGLGASLVSDSLRRPLAARRLNTFLVAAFATGAFVLALIGLYGVTSYNVTRESHEIGIRLALGAEPHRVTRLIVTRSARMILIGLVIGSAAALALTRLMRAALFDVDPNDPGTFVAVALVLLSVGTLAAYLPARRAAEIDPVKTIKQ